MDFTREPIIETVITPKEGCKLVVRSSKGIGQEEYFVDAVEVVTFGNAIFFRSLERPKAFIVPASDYEVLEVREARIVLKNVGLDRSIKIAGGREAPVKLPKEPQEERQEQQEPSSQEAPAYEGRGKRDRRRQPRRRRGREEMQPIQPPPQMAEESSSDLEREPQMGNGVTSEKPVEGEMPEGANPPSGSLMTRLLSPPPLISETISRYKEKFKDAFYSKEEQEAKMNIEEIETPGTITPESIPSGESPYSSFEISQEDEEEIYRQRRKTDFEDSENGFSPSEDVKPESDTLENSPSSEEIPTQEKRED